MPNEGAAGLVYGGVPGTGLATVLGGITTKKPLDIFLEQKKERQKQEAAQKVAGDKWLDDVLKYAPESWSPFTSQVQQEVEGHIDEGARINLMPEGETKRQAKINFAKEEGRISAHAKKSFDIKETFKVVDANIDALKTKYPGLKIENVRTQWRDYSLNPNRSGKNLDDVNVITMRNLDPYLDNADNWNMDIEAKNFVKGLPEIVNQLVKTRFGTLGLTTETIEYKNKFVETDANGEFILDEEGKPKINITPETVQLFKQHRSWNAFIKKEQERDSTLTEEDILERKISLYAYAGKKVKAKLTKYPTKKGEKIQPVAPLKKQTFNISAKVRDEEGNIVKDEEGRDKEVTLPLEGKNYQGFENVDKLRGVIISPTLFLDYVNNTVEKNIKGQIKVDITGIIEYAVNEEGKIVRSKTGKLPTLKAMRQNNYKLKKFAKIFIEKDKLGSRFVPFEDVEKEIKNSKVKLIEEVINTREELKSKGWSDERISWAINNHIVTVIE